VQLTTHLHQCQGQRMHGSMPPLTIRLHGGVLS